MSTSAARAGKQTDEGMPQTAAPDADAGGLVFERPRRLGPGVEMFNGDDVPITPRGFFVQPPEYPSALNIDGTFQMDPGRSGAAGLHVWDSFASQRTCGSETHTHRSDSLRTPSVQQSFVFGRNESLTRLHRILVIGPPGLVTTHVTARLLKHGYYVRLLGLHYHGDGALHRLDKLVETRPSHLSLFCGGDVLSAVADCDGVVYINGPDISHMTDERKIEYGFVRSIQDLFLSIKSNGKKVRRVVLITPASTLFPVETTLVIGARGLQRAQTAALREAERMSDKAGVPLTVILSAMVVGPSLLGEQDGNVHALVAFAGRRRLYTLPFYYNIVDVRDVAEACGLALISRTAEHQKYILSGGEMDLGQIACVLRECIPGIKPPRRTLPIFLARLLLYFGLLELFDFEFCERIAPERVGWSYPLSSSKAQRELELSLRSASSAVVAAVAHAMNVSAVPPLSVATDATVAWTGRRRKHHDRPHNRGVLLAGLCVTFSAIGYVCGSTFLRMRQLG